MKQKKLHRNYERESGETESAVLRTLPDAPNRCRNLTIGQIPNRFLPSIELGCGIGDLLAALAPSTGVGIDFSPAMIAIARQRHPALSFAIGDVESPETIGRWCCSFCCR